MQQNPIICALDTKITQDAIDQCKILKPYIGYIKLGLEFFTMNGPEGINQVKECDVPIFLDLKFHDIPNTVAQAVRSAVRLGVQMLTIHTIGGADMMKAAIDASEDEAAKLNIQAPLILGVTILTSMDQNDINQIGINNDIQRQVLKLAALAKASGLNGIVCSPLEISKIKTEISSKLQLVVPGIRPASSSQGDQKRIMTPQKAINEGADFLVIGRPITQSDDPAQAAKIILEEINNA